jgi:hypothetical protein
MILIKRKLAAATAVAAAFSMAATPAAAVELPRVSDAPQAWDPGALDVENRRHHHRGDWDDDDIDGEDILTGVLILGGLAAIAGIAGSGNKRQQSAPPPEPFPEDADYDAGYQAPARDDRYRSRGMADAVDACVAEAEEGHGPIGSVDRASRSGEGWYVAGELEGGTAFACWVDGSGRVTDLEAGAYGTSYDTPVDDGATASVQKQAVEPEGEDGYALAQAAE